MLDITSPILVQILHAACDFRRAPETNGALLTAGEAPTEAFHVYELRTVCRLRAVCRCVQEDRAICAAHRQRREAWACNFDLQYIASSGGGGARLQRLQKADSAASSL